ncbi:MAG: hypothetical protein BAJATHORv1_40246 [Candidatus Thorarchaeota archaeon]|nr:MAG: hypothetical protein BAJATHORv1_40246 [Candidatus Thorarchaeota archaeon]
MSNPDLNLLRSEYKQFVNTQTEAFIGDIVRLEVRIKGAHQNGII